MVERVVVAGLELVEGDCRLVGVRACSVCKLLQASDMSMTPTGYTWFWGYMTEVVRVVSMFDLVLRAFDPCCLDSLFGALFLGPGRLGQ